jgi:hypothetical protein
VAQVPTNANAESMQKIFMIVDLWYLFGIKQCAIYNNIM